MYLRTGKSPLIGLVSIYWTLGWIDVATFWRFFKNRHQAADQVYFCESNSKKSASFIFINHRELLKKYFFLKLCKYHYYVLQITIATKKLKSIFLNILRGPPNWAKLVFDLVKGKQNIV